MGPIICRAAALCWSCWFHRYQHVRCDASAMSPPCRLQQALQTEAPERAVEATGLLLDLAERLLNAFAAAVSLTGSADATAMQLLVSQYGAARQNTLQDALNGSIAVCTHGMPAMNTLKGGGSACLSI